MKNQIYPFTAILFICLSLSISAKAQIASGGTFKLDKSVVAGGGATSTDAASRFSIVGTIGQSIAGMPTSNSPFSTYSGFHTPNDFAPTAAEVTVAGKVFGLDNRGLVAATVVMIDTIGQARETKTKAFGYFQFENVRAGETYIITVSSKKYLFAPQILNFTDSTSELEFKAVGAAPKQKENIDPAGN